MSKKKCTKCQAFHWDWSRCHKWFKAHSLQYNDDEWFDASGVSFEDAAERLATQYNERSSDYTMIEHEEEFKVKLKDSEGNTRSFVVSAEPSIEYYVSENRELESTGI